MTSDETPTLQGLISNHPISSMGANFHFHYNQHEVVRQQTLVLLPKVLKEDENIPVCAGEGFLPSV